MKKQKKAPPKKTPQIRIQPHKMAISTLKRNQPPIKAKKTDKIRIVISCSTEEKMYIKILAAQEKKTISDYLLTTPRSKIQKSRCDFPGCRGEHKPNKLTQKVIKESESRKNLEHHETVEDFWKSMDVDINVDN